MLVVLLACKPPNILPDLGDQYQIRTPGKALSISSNNFSPYEEAEFEGIEFEVAADDGKVVYLATRDPRFKTEEGISVDSTLQEVLNAGADLPVEERGWGFYTKLKSGWCVGFDFLAEENGRLVESGPPKKETKVSWIFKRY